MRRLRKFSPARRRRLGVMMVAAVAGFATAALVTIAVAKTFSLQVADNATVTDTKQVTKHENIVVTSHGSAVYDLSGDSKSHPKCTKKNGCFQIWPPATVSSPKNRSKAPGISGKLGVWHRNGFFQLTLGGRPLYRFAPDTHKRVATGEGIHSFGGTWHVRVIAGAPTGTTTTTTATTTTTTPCVYPPYC